MLSDLLVVKCVSYYNHPTHPRVHQMKGEGVDMGEEAAGWVSEFLKLEGCRMYYMSPQHKPRVILDDDRWREMGIPGEEVG